MKKIIFLLIFTLSSSIHAQKSFLEGVVKYKGTPVVANIIIKNTTTGTMSNFDGEYSLNIPSSKQKLVVSAVGFKTKEIEISQITG